MSWPYAPFALKIRTSDEPLVPRSYSIHRVRHVPLGSFAATDRSEDAREQKQVQYFDGVALEAGVVALDRGGLIGPSSVPIRRRDARPF
ncbi:hypothetical protein [Halalkalicoccus ordinarius]|uniref:hypothetical protein n=1 Tax=Halalkalicoccus ordinarius TaxID=3116651 RepID=UPI00300F4BC5